DQSRGSEPDGLSERALELQADDPHTLDQLTPAQALEGLGRGHRVSRRTRDRYVRLRRGGRRIGVLLGVQLMLIHGVTRSRSGGQGMSAETRGKMARASATSASYRPSYRDAKWIRMSSPTPASRASS